MFSNTAAQMRQLGSLLQRQRDRLKTFPAMESFSGSLEAMANIDGKLDNLTAELEQLLVLTKDFFPNRQHIYHLDRSSVLLALIGRASRMNQTLT